MKHHLYKPIKYKSLISLACLLLISSILSSCLKNSAHDSSSIVSALSVVNASPDSPPLELILDNKRVKSFSYPENKINYFPVFLGYHLARVYEAGKLHSPLYEVELTLHQGKFYTIYLAGRMGSLTSLTLEDDMTIPPTGNAKIRFINLSTDSPALDFQIDSDSMLASDTTLASNKKFKQYTGFQNVKAGVYSASINSNDGNSVAMNFNIEIESGKIYTIWARGLVETSSEEEAFSYSIVTHNPQ